MGGTKASGKRKKGDSPIEREFDLEPSGIRGRIANGERHYICQTELPVVDDSNKDALKMPVGKLIPRELWPKY